jgi:hypothetical protein
MGDVKLCMFPTFRGESGEKKVLMNTVKMEELSKLSKLAKASKDDFQSMLQAAWALVLRCYTGQDEICFGYQECADSIMKAIDVGGKEGQRAVSVVSLNLDDGATIWETYESMKKSRHHTELKALPGQQPFNTMMTFNMRSQSGIGAESLRHSFLENFAMKTGVSFAPASVQSRC